MTAIITASHLVAPSASAASRFASGVVFITSTETATMVGRIITARMMLEAR